MKVIQTVGWIRGDNLTGAQWADLSVASWFWGKCMTGSLYIIVLILKKKNCQGFPSRPMVETSPSNAVGVVRSLAVELRSHISHGQKNPKIKNRSNIVKNSIKTLKMIHIKKILKKYMSSKKPKNLQVLTYHLKSTFITTSVYRLTYKTLRVKKKKNSQGFFFETKILA